MMTHYIDVTLLLDPEFSQAHLLGALYAKLHRTLAQLQAHDIGVSFPEYSLRPRSLGTMLRIHGGESSLVQLMSTEWLSGMRDHVTLSVVKPVPQAAMHRTVQRRQFKTNSERLRRRRMRRKAETAAQAAAAIPDSMERTPHLPYVQFHSATTGQSFCLFIEYGKIQAELVDGDFNTYGLSHGATIPWF